MLYLLKKQTLNLLKVKRLKIIPVVPVGLEPKGFAFRRNQLS